MTDDLVTVRGPLVRYTGPRSAYVGAIGYAVTGLAGALTGVEIRGRVIPATRAQACVYQVWRDDVCVSAWLSWRLAAAEMPGSPIVDHLRPCGLEMTDGESVWRLVPV